MKLEIKANKATKLVKKYTKNQKLKGHLIEINELKTN